ncbi:MAG: nucleotidyltransferase domain-containing protein [Candidatus ainarchaeum sp.]|nr:nucleotidyltransferase domain-containing protein [Candidatus ainarchaeum sp.]
MLTKFNSFVGFKILNFFCLNPNTILNISEISRKLVLSKASSKYYCDFFLKEKIFLVDLISNQKRFRLNNESIYVKELKKTISLLWFKEIGLEKIVSNANSFAIYGSFASGEFDEKSDLDLLVIGTKENIDFRLLSIFEKTINRPIQLTIYNWVEWRKMSLEKNVFVDAVLKRSILVKGNNL